jgi:DNA invertase Pin-like site-specific DNA recombinase
MAAKKRVGDILGYARVSTDDQDLAGQRQRLADAGAIRTFEDVVSGKRFDRPGLNDLIDHARPGDTLCVVRLDRLGRSLKELLETVDELKRREVNFMSLEEKIDTASAAGELIFHVFGAIAHFERRLIGERTRDGLAAAKARGARAGRPPLDQDKVAAASALVASGLSPTAAAQHLGLGRSTVYRELRRA